MGFDGADALSSHKMRDELSTVGGIERQRIVPQGLSNGA
jgi:hypothetical protein